MTTVPAVGPKDARLAIIGEAPGRTEIMLGEPFVGPSGKILTAALSGHREAAYITNVRKFLPPKKESQKEKDASLHEWVPMLARELSDLPRVQTLLCVGGDALRAVLGCSQISYYHGSVFTRAEADAIREATRPSVPVVEALPPSVHTVIATLHPAYALRGKPMFRPMIQATMARAARWANQEQGPARAHIPTWALETSAAGLAEFLATEDNAHCAVSLDVETPLTNNKQIDICGVATLAGVRVFPWSSEHREVIHDFLVRPGMVVGHNVTFDLRALAAYGLRPDKKHVIDTIAGAALLWPPSAATKEARWLALSTCVTRVLDGVAYWKSIPRKNAPPDLTVRNAIYRASYGNVPEWLYERLYCGLDNYYQVRLWGAQRELLKREGML